MSAIKVGDRVKVEYEGEVLWVDDAGDFVGVRSDNGFDNSYSAAVVTKVALPEPPVGSVVVVRTGDPESQFSLSTYKRWPGEWFNSSGSAVSWKIIRDLDIIAIHEPEAS